MRRDLVVAPFEEARHVEGGCGERDVEFAESPAPQDWERDAGGEETFTFTFELRRQGNQLHRVLVSLEGSRVTRVRVGAARRG